MAHLVQEFNEAFTALKEQAGPDWDRQFEAANTAFQNAADDEGRFTAHLMMVKLGRDIDPSPIPAETVAQAISAIILGIYCSREGLEIDFDAIAKQDFEGTQKPNASKLDERTAKIIAGTFEEFGEPALASLFMRDRAEFLRRCELGREWFKGVVGA